jgi:hypothetical protein
MRAPATGRGIDAITQDIVKELEAGEPLLATIVTIDASIKRLKALKKIGAPIWGYQRENVEAIRDIESLSHELLEAFRKMPDAARVLLFMPEESGEADRLPSKAIQEKSRNRARKVTSMLNYLERRGGKIIALRPGKHGATEYLKHYCADEAWRIMQINCKKPASGARTSILGKIASLLYEAVTGKYGLDLERECGGALKRGDAGDIPVHGYTIGGGQLPQ